MSPARSVLIDLGVALAACGGAAALQLAIWRHIPHPHLLFYPAIFVAGRTRGFRSGALCTVLSTYAIAYWFLPPARSLAIARMDDAIDLVIFTALGLGISATLDRLRSALARSRAAEAEAKRAKDATEAVWSMIAHDLRTPLSVITLSSGELERLDRNQLQRSVQVIQRSADRAADLLHDALEAMRLSGGALPIEPRACDLRELAATAIDAVRPLAKRRGVELDLDVPPGVVVRADERRILQVLTNLLGNATKVSGEGAHVRVGADARDGSAIVVVEDEGPGIPSDKLEAIFSKFWGAGPQAGTGLGLWIARAIVEAHGATLDVASEVGTGTRFSFRLPRMDDARSTRGGSDPVDRA